MTTALPGPDSLTAKVACRRKRLWPCLLALALAVPGVAYPYDLQQLLRMPLERLLQLEISPRRVAQGGGIGRPAAARLAHDQAHHAA